MALTNTEKLALAIVGKGRLSRPKAAELAGMEYDQAKDLFAKMAEQSDKYAMEIARNGSVAVYHVRWTGNTPPDNYKEIIRATRYPPRSWWWAHSLMPGR